MDRRRFIRVAGGGVIVAAGLPAAGCAPAMPPQAVAPWQGPAAHAELRRWVLGYAILAPHSHNLQSWLVDLRQPGEITLFCDRTRLLPVTDPFSRQIMMSQGTFIELLDIAARERGQRAEVQLFPEGAFGPAGPDDRPVARIRLQPDTAVARDPQGGGGEPPRHGMGGRRPVCEPRAHAARRPIGCTATVAQGGHTRRL